MEKSCGRKLMVEYGPNVTIDFFFQLATFPTAVSKKKFEEGFFFRVRVQIVYNSIKINVEE